jgi:glycogen debranching enzyme
MGWIMVRAQQRATPADPVPGSVTDVSIPRSDGRKLPPQLGPDAVVVLEDTSFMYSNAAGDVPAGSIGGLVHADTRFLNRWLLTVNGAPPLVLRSATVDHFSAAFFLTNEELPGLAANSVSIHRFRSIGDDLYERIELRHCAKDPIHVELRLAVGTDFADLFEIKDKVRDRSSQISRKHADNGSRLVFAYCNGDFTTQTTVEASPAANRVEVDDLVWELDLANGAEWRLEVRVPLTRGDQAEAGRSGFGEVLGVGAPDPVREWLAEVPSITGDSATLTAVAAKSARDLLALRIRIRLGDHLVTLPAAGLPWFLTLFGRDTLITAFQTVCYAPQLARGALMALASLQGRASNPVNDEEPGKILHEIRFGELTRLGLKPHSPYYGTADATQLWLVLLSEYWRWTRDDSLVQQMRGNVLAALEWIDRYGDRDGDGYVEYATCTPQGLGNQCWRDSWDGIQFADGRIPSLPIATCEVQGYTYDAKLRVAELADGPLDDPLLAGRLRDEANLLRERFNRDFWINERGGYYAVGLDGDKHQIDSMTSNMGHLLWSGIVPEDRAPVIASQLTSEEMFSGWGVRTLSTADGGYNPIGYHLGTVWPHDNSLIAAGLARYGLWAESNRIALALFDAATFTDYRLPEAFSGHARDAAPFPVPYPTACSPQAWATAAPLLAIRTMLGLGVREGRVVLDPHIPSEIGRILVTGTHAFGNRWDVEANGTNGYISLAAR